MVRARILSAEVINLSEAHEAARMVSASASGHRYQQFDPLPFEISALKYNNLVLLGKRDEGEIDHYLEELSKEDLKFRLNDKVDELRVAYRVDHLESIRDKLELFCYERAKISSEDPESNADWFIKIARAVLPLNSEDAEAYFDLAIDAVSKFGDEAVERWEALVSIAQRSAESEYQTAEVAYRFMRCAELIGDTVAREKYFDRNETVDTCFSLSPESTFAILSRWKDRDVGWSVRQLPPLANKAVSSNLIPASAGWSLSAFAWEGELNDFAFLCIEKEDNKVKQQIIFDCLVKNLRVRDITGSIWEKIAKFAKTHKLYFSKLDCLIDLSTIPEKHKEKVYQQSYVENNNKPNWKKLLYGLDLTSSNGLSNAISVFNNLDAPKDSDYFWNEIFILISVRDTGRFLLALVDAENAGFYDIKNALENFPPNWKNKPSVEKQWKLARHPRYISF